MMKLDSLKNLLNALTKEEYASLISFLKSNNRYISKTQLKSIQLVEIIKDNKNYTSNEIQLTLYQKINSTAFNKLMNRLYRKVLEVLTFDSNLFNGKYSLRNKVVFELRKKLLQLDLLILKGIRENLDRELDYIIHKARVYEIYDILIQSLYSKQRFLTVQLSNKQAETIKDDIIHAERCWMVFNNSQSIFNTISSRISASSIDENISTELNNAVRCLKDSYEQIHSPTVLYYYLMLATEQAQKKNEFRKASAYLESLLRNVSMNKSVYTDYRYGITLINISNNNIHTYEFDKALETIAEAKKYFQGQPVNLSIAEEIQFYIQFYTGDIQNARKTITKLANSPNAMNVPLLLSKWMYLSASTSFLEQNFERAIEEFSLSSEIEQDKEGWNFTKRIMILLTKIELNDFDSVDLGIQSLDKFMKRILKAKYIRPRLIIIVRILRKLINENYDYKKVYAQRKKYFDLLKSTDPEYCWQIKSPELIIFDQWFMSHVNKTLYDPFIVVRNSKGY